MDVSKGWDFLAITIEGDPVDLAGMNVWEVEWKPVPVGNVTVAHPSYPRQRHEMSVYKVCDAGSITFFAAGEFSNGVWGFYLPADSMKDFLQRFHT